MRKRKKKPTKKPTAIQELRKLRLDIRRDLRVGMNGNHQQLSVMIDRLMQLRLGERVAQLDIMIASMAHVQNRLVMLIDGTLTADDAVRERMNGH